MWALCGPQNEGALGKSWDEVKFLTIEQSRILTMSHDSITDYLKTSDIAKARKYLEETKEKRAARPNKEEIMRRRREAAKNGQS